MKVINIQLQRDKLLSIPQDERRFFVSIGHSANEINAITKLMYWASITSINSQAEDHGRFTILLLLIRLLAGKLWESWVLYKSKFFGTAISRYYEPMLEGEPANALNSLKRYFGSRNAANLIRNHFGFHYSPDDVDRVLPEVDELLDLYLEREAAPNNLFFFSEALVGKALLVMLEEEGKQTSMEDLVDELFEVSAWFALASDGLMVAIIDRHGEELRARDPEEVQFDDLLDFRSIQLPWFTETAGVVDSVQ